MRIITGPKVYSLGWLFIVKAIIRAKFLGWKIMLGTKMNEIFLRKTLLLKVRLIACLRKQPILTLLA